MHITCASCAMPEPEAIPRLVAVVAPEPQAPGCTSPTRCDEGSCHGKLTWCLGPDSNRHGVAPKGFSYHCSFRCCMRGPCISWSGLYLCRPDIRSLPAAGLGRGRQVSTLSLTDGRSAVSPAVGGLSSVLQPP